MRRLTSLVLIALLTVAAIAGDVKQQAQDKYVKAERESKRLHIMAAEKLLKEALALDPTHLKAQHLLADIYSNLRRNTEAAAAYRRVLELNATQKQLNESEIRDVTNTMGVAYAQSQQLEESRKVFEKAVEDDPEYAIYHYNLACTYSELGDLERALPELKKAWELRGKLPRGEDLLDPRTDSSFKRWLNDKRFQDAVRYMVI